MYSANSGWLSCSVLNWGVVFRGTPAEIPVFGQYQSFRNRAGRAFHHFFGDYFPHWIGLKAISRLKKSGTLFTIYFTVPLILKAYQTT
jgi:hypothetical protein